jgi:hypothetical protein
VVHRSNAAGRISHLVQVLQGIRGEQLGAELPWEGHESQDIGLGGIDESGELFDLGPEIVGDLAPLQDGGIIVRLGKGGADCVIRSIATTD